MKRTFSLNWKLSYGVPFYQQTYSNYTVYIILTKKYYYSLKIKGKFRGKSENQEEIKTQGKLLFCNPAGYLINPKFIQSSKELQVQFQFDFFRGVLEFEDGGWEQEKAIPSGDRDWANTRQQTNQESEMDGVPDCEPGQHGQPGLVTNSIVFCWHFTIRGR